MKLSLRLLYLAAFATLAVITALAAAGMARSQVAGLFAAAALLATLAGAPGLVNRRAWPLALVLLPLGAYLLARAQLPPGPRVEGLGEQLGFYWDQLRASMGTYADARLPLDLDAARDLRLLFVLGLYAAVGLASFLALSLRLALPAVAVLLVVLGFAFTIDQSERRVWLPLAFLALAAAVLVFSRALDRQRWRPRDTLAGVATAVIASLAALSLIGATSVAANEPWQDWRTWDLSSAGHGGVRLAFDWMDDYERLLDPNDDAEVMRVSSSLPSYWRANALDFFNGVGWYHGGSYVDRLEGSGGPGRRIYPVPARGPQPPGQLVRQTFTLSSAASDYYLAGGVARSVILPEPRPVFLNDVQGVASDGTLRSGTSYQVTAVVPRVEPGDLVGRGRDYPLDVAEQARLPFPSAEELGEGPVSREEWRRLSGGSARAEEWYGIERLNRTIIGDATDPYQIALRIEEHLRLAYGYSLTPPPSQFESPYTAFLFDTRQGFCQQFAGSMAALLRFNGIPARIAVGFATGERVLEGRYVVTRNDAHAWVEVYFPGVGWVPFDPTPGRGIPGPGASTTSAGFDDPFTGEQALSSGGDESQAALPDERGDRGADPGGAGPGATEQDDQGSGGGGGAAPWLAAAFVALLLAWPLGRVGLAALRLRRGDADRRLRAAWTLMHADLRDFGLARPPAATLDETSAWMEHDLGMDARPMARRTEAVLYGGHEATEGDAQAARALRRRLRRRLRARRGWRRALFALYGVRRRRLGGA